MAEEVPEFYQKQLEYIRKHPDVHSARYSSTPPASSGPHLEYIPPGPHIKVNTYLPRAVLYREQGGVLYVYKREDYLVNMYFFLEAKYAIHNALYVSSPHIDTTHTAQHIPFAPHGGVSVYKGGLEFEGRGVGVLGICSNDYSRATTDFVKTPSDRRDVYKYLLVLLYISAHGNYPDGSKVTLHPVFDPLAKNAMETFRRESRPRK